MEDSKKTIFKGEIKLSRRKATQEDTAFARHTHHTAYHDVIIEQFGAFDEAFEDAFFAKSWTPETHEILVDGNTDIGYCHIERTSSKIILHELLVLPFAQRKGIGATILQELIDESKTNNIPIRLNVLKENKAQHLYRRLGFKDIGTTDIDIIMEFNPCV